MKKLSLILLLLLPLIFLNSCDTEDKGNSPFSTIVSAGKHEFNFGVIVNTSGTLDINVYSNDISSSDRTFNISISEESTGSSSDYSVPSSVTIPAKTNVGTLTISAEDITNTLILELESVPGIIITGPIVVNILKVCPFDLDNFVGTYTAVEDGLYSYDVTVERGTGDDDLILTNLYETGGKTKIIVDIANEESPSVSFASFNTGNVLYVHSTYGDVYAVNPSTYSGNASEDTSALNVCDTAISLAFVRQVSAGIFSNIVKVEMTKK